jgi:hypothetical protein
MEHEARAGDGVDSWRISRLREQPRRARGVEGVERLLGPRDARDPLVDRLRSLEDALLELGVRLEAVESERTVHLAPALRAGPASPTPTLGLSARGVHETAHTLLVPTPHGYEILEEEGAPPPLGASVTIGGRRYTVEGRRRTPLPHDRRPCFVLEPVLTPDESDSQHA